MRSRKFRGAAATGAVEVVAVAAEATLEVVEAAHVVGAVAVEHAAVATEVVEEAAHAVVAEEAVHARLPYRAVAEEDNDWPVAATGLVPELVWYHKVAVAEVAEGAIGPAEISLHDRIEIRAELPRYPGTLAEDGPGVQVADQDRRVVRVLASGLHLQIGLG